jgi:hypothetical protein
MVHIVISAPWKLRQEDKFEASLGYVVWDYSVVYSGTLSQKTNKGLLWQVSTHVKAKVVVMKCLLVN